MFSTATSSGNNNRLYIHRDTLHCATTECIPCFYKIFPSGFCCTLKLPPNLRPECCPRSSPEVFSCPSFYKPNHNLLTVGDGDFSFSLSIARSLEQHSDLNGTFVATSHESLEQLNETYNSVGVKEILRNLHDCGVFVAHGVDATDFESTAPFLKLAYFDFIIWNFPCVRAEKGADGQASEIEINKNLLRSFFINAHKYLKNGTGRIHITHKTIEPFSWWGIIELAEECEFRYCYSIVFDR